MALFTKVMGFTGLLGLVIGGVSVALIWLTVRETQRMANDTRDIGEAQARAYISCAEGAFEVNTQGVWCTVPIENVGQSPAVSVKARCIIDFSGEANRANQRVELWSTIADAIGPQGTENAIGFCNVDGDPTIRVTGILKPNPPIPEITSAAAEGMINGDRFFFSVEVTVGWTDVFGRRQNTTFYLGADSTAQAQQNDAGSKFRSGVLRRKGSAGYKEIGK